MPLVTDETQDALAGVAAGHVGALSAGREPELDGSGLDSRVAGLVRIASLIALDGPPASYTREVASAIEAGASAEDILGVLRAVAAHVGRPRVIAAAAEIMLALGLSLPEAPVPG
jgi:alkylhydroperoxidase/carboxymuconolactone decarboxylase family protein YurZ